MDRELYGTSDDGVLEETDVGDFSEHRLGSFRVPAPHAPVTAWNEWDPLEEVIVGSLDGATIPTHHLADSDGSRPPIPTRSRPAFRFDVGHHSEMKPAT
ncbi:hypothetical protein ADL19_26475, partial [Streptomyces purpurogeneiscleroticus]